MVSVLFLTCGALVAVAQAPQDKISYGDRAGTTGHTITVNGKSFGPYANVDDVVYSRTGTAVVFLVDKKDKKYVIAGGKEFGPFAAGYDADSPTVSDDGAVWTIILTHAGGDNGEDSSLLLVNGTQYGPYAEIQDVQTAETGGAWIAQAKVADDQYKVLQNGKVLGPFTSITAAWVSPDGTFSGYAYDDDSGTHVVLPNKTYDNVDATDFEGLDLLAPHWAYSIHPKDADQDIIVVDGKSLTGYSEFGSFLLSPSGRHYAFAATKIGQDADTPVIVVDGKEYIGENPSTGRVGSQEYFFWTIVDGEKTTLQSLAVSSSP